MAPRLPDTKPRAGTFQKYPEPSSMKHSSRQVPDSPSAAQLKKELESSMSRLNVTDHPGTPNAMISNNTGRPGLRFEDDQTQMSCSSTKPASSDSRSATSGITYAMDERESLRPDDSASTKAAEDEDSNSGPASGAPSSRVGSEAGGRAFQDQYHEIGRIGPGLHRLQPGYRRGIPGITEEASQPTFPPLDSALTAPVHEPDAFASKPSPYSPSGKPDEKLLEALESSKDRLFLMRLEQEVITFVKHSTEPTLELPPCNSFCRLLAHKLADYYALTHYVDNAVTSVRLYRTPYCRIPPPLSEMVKAQSPTETTPISRPGVQIMRREGMGREERNVGSTANTTASSMAPSKAGSETGDSQLGTGVVSPTESVNAREKGTMTREEREAQYKEARERIFKGYEEFETGEGTPGEAVNVVSRTSSGNGKRKKKPKRVNDDFEARSQFGIYYPTQYPPSTYESAPNPMAYYGPYTQQGGMMAQNGDLNVAMFHQGYSQGFNSLTNPPAYPIGMSNTSMPVSDMNGHFTGMPMYTDYGQQYPPQYSQQSQYFQPMMQQQPMMAQQSPNSSSPAPAQLSRQSSQMSDPNWSQEGYSYPYQQPRQQQPGYMSQMQERNLSAGDPMAYPYGQLPYQSMQQPNAQHPLPGSYNRQVFNPQTRSFVPGSGYHSPKKPQFGGISVDSANRSPLITLSNGNSSSSPRQQSSNSLQRPALQPSNSSSGRKTSSQSASSLPTASQPSSLAKWGTPANLPPKPPPPETPIPEGQRSLPAVIHAPVNIHPIMNGQPMPSFQNGVYSMPNPGSR